MPLPRHKGTAILSQQRTCVCRCKGQTHQPFRHPGRPKTKYWHQWIQFPGVVTPGGNFAGSQYETIGSPIIHNVSLANNDRDHCNLFT